MSRRRARMQNNASQQQREQSQLALNQLAINQAISRMEFAQRIGQAFGGRRDYWDVFGYPQTLSYSDYLQWYQRGGIAKPIIDLPRDKCWSSDPVVQEDENQYNDTPFETGYKEIVDRFGLNRLYKRADVLAALGHYSVMLIGVNRVGALSEPIPPGSLRGPQDVAYLSLYSEANAKIYALDNVQENNPHFGKPLLYQINIGSPDIIVGPAITRTEIVHYSRIVHFVEGALEDEFWGTPQLEAVFNHLHDLMKTIGGGAEIYWLNARNGMTVTLEDGNSLSLDSPEGKQLIEDTEAMANQLKRVLFLQGAKAQTLLNNQPIDPRGATQVIMDQVAAIAQIPKRILVGSEQGEQASTQDRINFAELNGGRREHTLTPGFVLKAANHFVELGALPKPANGPFCKWKPLLELDELQKSTVAHNKSSAVQEYLTHPEAVQLLAPGEFRKMIGLDAEMAPEMAATIDVIFSLLQNRPPAPTLPVPAQETLPVTNAVLPVSEPPVTREELFRLEDRIVEAIRNLPQPQQQPRTSESPLRGLWRPSTESREVREQLVALTQQVQTALLHSASETQLNALGQQVAQCLQQLTLLSTREPAPASAPTFNVSVPDSLKSHDLFVTLSQPLVTEETIIRDPETMEIVKVVSEITKMSDAKVQAVATNKEPEMVIVPAEPLKYTQQKIKNEHGDIVKIIQKAVGE